MFSLFGIALHYIQDMWTLAPRLKDKHTPYEIKMNSAIILDDAKLQEIIKATLFPTKTEEALIGFLGIVNKGIDPINDNKVTAFALMGRPTSWGSPVVDLNFDYRLSREISRVVTLPPDKDSPQAISQIASHEEEKQALAVRIKAFPESYFEDGWNFVEMRDIVTLKTDEKWLEEDCSWSVDFPVIDSIAIEHLKFAKTVYENKIVLKEIRTVKTQKKGLFKKKHVISVDEVPIQTKVPKQVEVANFKITIKCTNARRKDLQSNIPIFAPELSLEFPSIEQASYAKAILGGILPKLNKHWKWRIDSQLHFLRDTLLCTKLPADNNNLSKVLEDYQKDHERIESLAQVIRNLEETKQTLWDDKDYLKALGY